MIQRKQTLYLLAAIVMTVICLCMQIGSFQISGLGGVARVYNLWYTALGKHYFDTWPLMAVLLPTTAIGTYAIFLYRSRKTQALLCLFNALLIASFMLMIAGLTLAFFFEPVVVKTDAEGYAVGGPKPEHMRIELGEEFREYEQTERKETT